MHLIATNLCVWIRTLTNEIRMELIHESEEHEGNSTGGHYGLAGGLYDGGEEEDCSKYRQHMTNASPYLFPFVMEYSLIATGTMALMSSEVSGTHKPDVIANIKQVSVSKMRLI